MFLEEYTLPLHGRFWIQVLSQIVSILHNPEFRKNLLDRLGTKKCQEFRLSVHSVRRASLRNIKTKV